ncbi:HAD family hydrolase [Sneathiella limimaris]|uniref:sulfotransferase-like domain-containing protein n=1 Tax=Sneathiella limimaris TaxID=1964213 RepID=UPI00146BBD14|nr:HAD family hydrolase [Sneathiella limimaris]
MSDGSSATILSMWSGPRNISTAMMRSFGSRPDCQPVDEPFYAYYLTETGLNHPMRAEILASQPEDWRQVSSDINAPLPDGKTLRYLKHMTQHMLPDIDLGAFASHKHCFLIRDPRLVIASFSAKYDQVTAEATGFHQQMRLFEYFDQQADHKPVIVEGEDIQKNPSGMLHALCSTLKLSFYPQMLEWEKGRKPEDGVWAAHWYNAVEASTGFAPYQAREATLTPEQEKLARELEPIYLELKSRKLKLEN